MARAASSAFVQRVWPTCTASLPRCCRPAWSASGKRRRMRKVGRMPGTPAETSVEHEVRVAARPETVFAFFTDPAKMVQWMGAEATLDPRPGGICRIAFQPTQEQVEFVGTDLLSERVQGSEPVGAEATTVMSGRYVEVDPYRRIELTLGWEQELLAVPPESTVVEVSF